MGVTGLWNIVTPLSKVLTLSELRGKVIAIDLSCWIVDSQTVGPADGCPKKYLRNIFFRTVALLLNGILPVFVLEGKAPTLKHDVIHQRNNARRDIREKKSSSQTAAKKGGRGNAFNATVKECETMLKHMGLICVKAHGEAEAMCAYINADGLVDGCITQDSDCFLYGAKTIYRNFTLNDKSGFGCAVEEYSLEKIQSIYNFGRNKMIALALLCGCDYGAGVPGVGKDGAMKWLQTVDDKDILEIFQNWSNDVNFHQPTTSSVNENNKGKLISIEYQIRKKCMAVENFPNQDLIDEFLVRKGPVPNQINKWDKPNVILLIEFLKKTLKWKSDYTIDKVIPILTRWNVENLTNIDLKLSIHSSEILIPKRIIKIRNIQSICNYEIEWDICTEQMDLTDLIDNENEYNGTAKTLSTIEPQELVKKAYPELVRIFEEAKAASKKKPARKRNVRKNDEQGDKKIDQYFKTKRVDVNEDLSKMQSTSLSSKQTNNMKTAKARLENGGNRIRKYHRKVLSKLDNTVGNIYETLGEEDFLTDVEEDALEMSLIVSRVCESTECQRIYDKTTTPLVTISKSNNIMSGCTTQTTNNCGNSDSDEFNDDIPYVPLDVRIKKLKG